jgi:hypothetical protein
MAGRQGKESEGPDVEGERTGDTSESEGALPGLPEILRKALTAGFSGFFLGEEAIRKALGDTLPKDWSDFAIEQSTRTRAEFLDRLSYEVARSLENIDLAAVLAQLLEGRTLEVEARVRLMPSEAGDRTDLKMKVVPGGEDE